MRPTQTTREDMLLLDRLFGDLKPEILPVSFCLDGKRFDGVPHSFSPGIRKRIVDSNMVETVISGEGPGQIRVRAEVTEYRDFPVFEWQFFIENAASTPSSILTDFYAMDFVFPAKSGVLHYGTGDTRCNENYDFFDQLIGPKPFITAPKRGYSCEGAYPYLRLTTDSYVASVAVGWGGQWLASVSKVSRGIRFTAGQQRMHARLMPGEEFCTPRMTVMLSADTDRDRAVNLWRRWYFKHVLPKVYGEPLPPKACMHVFRDNGPEFTGTTAENQIAGLRSYIRHGLKPDVWWIDAGWYPCDGDWKKIGTWCEDKKRFPDRGLAPIGEVCAKENVDFLLWFEPERVAKDSWLARHKKEWLLCDPAPASVGYYLFDLGNPEALNWMIERVCFLIRKWHVTVYRQDFNRIDLLSAWSNNETEDRVGALENRHIQGYWKYWEAILSRNPGLWIDACASGGRRNDLETMRRSVALHPTDFGYGNHPVTQFQTQSLYEWTPYFRSHTLSWDNEKGTYEPVSVHSGCDEFAFMNAMAPAITVMTTAWAEEDEIALAKKMLPIWRRSAEIQLRGDYYVHSRSDRTPHSLYAVEFSDPERGDGLFLAIRNTLCRKGGITARLHVDEKADYVLENGVTGEKREVSGRELARGFTVKLTRRSGVIWFYRIVNS